MHAWVRKLSISCLFYILYNQTYVFDSIVSFVFVSKGLYRSSSPQTRSWKLVLNQVNGNQINILPRKGLMHAALLEHCGIDASILIPQLRTTILTFGYIRECSMGLSRLNWAQKAEESTTT